VSGSFNLKKAKGDLHGVISDGDGGVANADLKPTKQ
jgi:hypothetical protein